MARKWYMLLACFSFASAHAAPSARNVPLQSVRTFAWLGSWESLQTPAIEAPAGIREEGTLGNAFRVEWQRNGQSFKVRITRLEEGWTGRLGVEFRIAPETKSLTYGFKGPGRAS
ncbi:MAG: hypothetical protein IT210_14755 [Armatimonadetes bacterium]|nr:hypothetical protein [Armatimonadota bacterium]